MLETVNNKLKYWYEIRKKLFGEEEARQWVKDNTPRYELISKICESKGFTTWSEYTEWEREHIEERNRIFGERRSISNGKLSEGVRSTVKRIGY